MRNRFMLSVLASDLIGLAASLAVASFVIFDTWAPWTVPLPATAGSTVWPFLGLMFGGLLVSSLFSMRMWGGATPRPSYGRALAIVSFTTAFTGLGVGFFRVYHSNGVLAITTVLWLAIALSHRALRRRRPWTERMVIVTSEKGLVDDIRQTAHAEILSVYDPGGEPPDLLDDVAGVSLVVDIRQVLSEPMAQFVSSWNIAGYPVRTFTAVYEQHTGRLAIVHLAEGWELAAPVARNAYAPFKRIIDFTLTALTLPLWLLIGGIAWLLVRLDTRGAAIYAQRRVGRGGREFTLYKFRTMVVGAETNGPQFAVRNDARITRSGRWLRRFRMDEIPQLWNVLKGDLSLVGPRPERPEFTDGFERRIPFYGQRHLVRPGVTGWAQVNYGYADDEAQTIDKLTYDLYYVKHMSVWLDLTVLGKSMWTVLSGFGAQ